MCVGKKSKMEQMKILVLIKSKPVHEIEMHNNLMS